jgi:transcriptional regulator with XRE-family HTH domain/predicted transcriptional regulator
MLDAGKIGRYISFLRKNNGMTQAQLADRLNVSHQAVSNWERGETLPDIEQLIGLAKVLNTTTDRILLAGASDAPEAEALPAEEMPIAEGMDEEVTDFSPRDDFTSDTGFGIKDKEDGIREIKDRINELHDRIREQSNAMSELDEKYRRAKSDKAIDKMQDYLDEALDRIDDLQDEADKLQDKMDELQDEADELQDKADEYSDDEIEDFQDEIEELQDQVEELHDEIEELYDEIEELQDELEDLIDDEDDADGEDDKEYTIPLTSSMQDPNDWQKIISMAPFASSETLERLLEELDLKKDINKIVQLAPFLKSHTIEDLIMKAMHDEDHPDWDIIRKLAPFAPGGVLDKLVPVLKEKASFKEICHISPFMSRSALEKLLIDIYKDYGFSKWEIIMKLVPFAGGSVLDQLVSEMETKEEIKRILRFAMFLNRETVDKLIRKIEDFLDDDADNWDMIMKLAPYASKASLDRLLMKMDPKRIGKIAPFLDKNTIDRFINRND